MNQNILYEITPKNKDDNEQLLDMDAYIAEIVDSNKNVDSYDNTADDNRDTNNRDDPSRIAAIELDYMTNYTVKMLSHILDYYKLSRRKLNKTEMVQIIVIFEHDPENEVIVATRRQLWKYLKRLRDDEYLSKYIIFDG
tara:strand:+ start:4904 stop:5320 length:417 start_codon:yes stop_codon:yes gene_type:complete